jgi:hypothetical protein
MAIFNSYVKFQEGNIWANYKELTATEPWNHDFSWGPLVTALSVKSDMGNETRIFWGRVM